MIILNEYKWAENALKNKDLGRKPSQTLGIVAKYYVHQGMKKRELRGALEKFYMQCRSGASVKDMSNHIEIAISSYSRWPLSIVDEIVITEPEMATIKQLKGSQLQKLAFVLLCVAKYGMLSKSNDKTWVNLKDSEIMQLANINTSVRRQCDLFGRLIEAGLLNPSKMVDNLNTQVAFMEEGDVAMRVTDFRNLGYQYLMYRGGPYYVCERCGITERRKNPKTGRPPKYCEHCANEVLLQQRVNAGMRFRAAHMDEKEAKSQIHE